ncbi:histidine kinase [Clostridium polyendosporum]|uniref:Circadian input-output histidine kinase CikA n=1 Tax=Clostridium polyendosporum TaxID=69208 RepID=A0A919S182_9CLOT|nr:response regulator [Clostridium polyendosporum]GIM29290.1 histidine kinase [Clostridium polyendosporum]
MNIFKNFSIKQRFFILFFVCVTTFIGFGIFALFKLNNLAQVTHSLYNQSSKVSAATVNAKVNLVKIDSSMKDVILSSNSDEIQKEINKVAQYESDLQKNLDTIQQNSDDSNIKRNLQDANNLLSKWWKPQREKIIKNMLEGKKDEAIAISKGISSDFVDQFELDLNNIYLSSSDNEINLIGESNLLQYSARTTLIFTLVILLSILLVLFILIITSILNPINNLKNHMIKITSSGELEEYEITQKGEITDMAKNYNILIKKLKTELWINTNRNYLSNEMTGNMSVKELTQNTINTLSKLLDAENGAFYTLDHKENKLILNSTFARTEAQRASNICELGDGISGQAALERRPILLKNVRRSETPSIDVIPLNVYAFPLIYEEKLYGVIEVSSFEFFNDLKQQFTEVISSAIAINLFSAIQNEKIKELLEVSEEATNKAQEISNQLKSANEVLEEQQRQLQVQTEELQQTNAQLEEQQQILEQQSEEMQQTNSQLEEHQLQLEEQARLLSVQNDELETSKKEILKRAKAYEMANKYKSQFLANISHELRTPLNSIILLSNLLIRNSKDNIANSVQEKIKVIYNAGNHLHRLINDILDLSKIEAGKIDLNYRYFNSSELIEELGEMFDQFAKEKNIQFILEDQFKDTLYGDKEKISQVLRNFLANAFKFTDQGSVELKIKKNKEYENNIVFSVKDTGIGIPKDKLDIIFDEFHQADGSISRKYGGTGLGLTISNKLSELMKGKIKVESELGIGSTFSLSLPLMVLVEQDFSNKEIAATANNELQNIEAGQTEEIKSKKHKNLLIIEDDKNLSESIKAISEGIGFSVLTSSNGAKGLKLINEHQIDGILLDLGLPDIKGIDLLKEIKTSLQLKNLNIPVIIYTGMEISTEQEKELKLYADSIIIKTTNSDERLLDELTLVLHKVKNKVKNEEDYKSIMTSRISKNRALNLDDKKILIVDDDPRNIFVLAAALEDCGAEIIEAENGKEALEKLKNEFVDLILMDIMMPVMNGYEAIKEIRNTDKIKHIPIIATTAKSLKDDREKCMTAGANDYISKPIDYDILITLIKAWINKP